MNTKNWQTSLVAFVLFICAHLVYAGNPLWTFTPLTATTVLVPVNGNEIIRYRITNQSKKTHTLAMKALPGITQITTTGNCAGIFTLQSQQSCILSLAVSGANLKSNINDGPVVCQFGSSLQCYQPSQANKLNVQMADQQANLVGGTVAGLTGTLILQNNGTDALSINANGSFSFTTPVAEGSPYNVTVQSQPASQTCTVSQGAGIMGDTAVTNVAVVCSVNPYTVGGTISGLTANGLILQNNNSDNLSLSSGATSFTFANSIAEGSSYNVTVLQQPTGLGCTVSNGSGTNVMVNITNVVVTCNPDGFLTSMAGSPYTTGATPQDVGVSPDGRFVYVANVGSSTISGYNITPGTGVLTPIAGSPFSGPSTSLTNGFIAFNGNYAYITVDNGVAAYSINNLGVLTPLAGSPFSATNPWTIAINPTGSFAYVLNRNFSAPYAVSVYSINPTTGVLGAPSSLSLAVEPINLVISPDGRFLYIATLANTILTFEINSTTGQLTPIGSAVSTGNNPLGIAVTPNGNFLYVVNILDSTLSSYSINTTTGILTAAATMPTINDPRDIIISPDGRFAYVTAYISQAIAGYSINTITGALTALAGSPFAADPTSLPAFGAISPNGQFLYVGNYGDSILGYNITQ